MAAIEAENQMENISLQEREFAHDQKQEELNK